MSTLVVLDYVTCSVLFIRLTDEIVKSLEEEYDNDSEAWIAESDLEEKYGFSISNSNWMLSDYEPEIFKCDGGDMVRMHLFA